MSERISNKKQNLDGIDPQESLIKSLESIKSLLKQGDSKINQARENIARADSISSDNLELRKTELKKNSIQNSSYDNSNSSQEIIIENTQHNILNDIDDSDIEEIIVEALPENNIFNSNLKSSSTISKPELEFEITNNLDLANAKPDAIAVDIKPLEKNHPVKESDNFPEKAGLNELYDHDLIVPMLDEIVMPEDQNSSLFNMDSSVEIKLDEKLKSSLLELSEIDDESNELNPPEKDNTVKSGYNSINNLPETATKADIISFELNSNIKKNNFKKIDNSTMESELAKPDSTKKQSTISLVENSLVDIHKLPDLESKVDPILVPNQDTKSEQVIIKETTKNAVTEKSKPVEDLAQIDKKITSVKTKTSNNPTPSLEKNLTTAINISTDTDNALSNISKTNNKITKDDKFNKKSIPGEEIDFSAIDGLERLKFNADKMSSLQKRVEKRVHNRLIQLIVQLDDEIKHIFSDEIKNCIAHELENKDKN